MTRWRTPSPARLLVCEVMMTRSPYPIPGTDGLGPGVAYGQRANKQAMREGREPGRYPRFYPSHSPEWQRLLERERAKKRALT